MLRIGCVDDENYESNEHVEDEEQIGGVWQIGSIEEDSKDGFFCTQDRIDPLVQNGFDEVMCEQCVDWAHEVKKKAGREIVHTNWLSDKGKLD